MFQFKSILSFSECPREAADFTDSAELTKAYNEG
ncbi:hypothetical protein OROGR_002279 [Orobanche gracilis]